MTRDTSPDVLRLITVRKVRLALAVAAPAAVVAVARLWR